MKKLLSSLSLAIVFLLLICQVNSEKAHDLKVIIMSTSKFWFNFRQATNTLLIYDILKKNGVRDEDIILMIPENSACNPRNNNPGVVCHLEQESEPNLYRNSEIDYKLSDVNVHTLTNMLRGKYHRYTPRSKRLVTNKNTKILTYFTGHGGSGYIKMQDTDVMMDEEMRVALEEFNLKNFYNEMLMFSDSCSAATIFEKLRPDTNPNIFGIGSSSRGQYSYSFGKDSNINLSVVDRFTRANYLFLANDFVRNKDSVLSDIMKEWTHEYLSGDFSYTNTHAKKDHKNIYLKDFFSNLNPTTSNILDMSPKDHHYGQLDALLGEIISQPTVNFSIENKPFI
ncbi:hypothetical protein ABPG72_016403 [Tetrahymena utriculariae]